MKFYGNGVVWDAENNRRLCKFVNGVFDTEDERVIKILTKAGYDNEYKGDLIVDVEESEVDIYTMGVRELKAYCKECGYEGYTNMKKNELVAFIEEKEGF